MRILFISILITTVALSYGQDKSSKILLDEGNQAFANQKYNDAIEKYESAKGSAGYNKADYNKANSLYKLKKYEEATTEYESMLGKFSSKKAKAGAYHNLGNSYMAQKKYKEAAAAFKNSLKNDPSDEKTRYNLAYALEKLKEQNQDNQENKDDQKKDQDKKDYQKKDQENKDDQKKDQENKDQQKKDQEKKDQEKKDQENKDQQNKDDQKKDEGNKGEDQKPGEGEPKPEPGKISRAQALRDLDAINNAEKKTLMKLQKKKADQKAKPNSTGKDW